MKTTCFIIKFTKLPDHVKEVVKSWCGFHNDCLIPSRTEFEAEDYAEGMAAIEDYHKDQVDTNNYKGTLEKFIKDYGLEFDVWMIEQKFNLKGVKRILIDISW
jgi:hypothetical protein